MGQPTHQQDGLHSLLQGIRLFLWKNQPIFVLANISSTKHGLVLLYYSQGTRGTPIKLRIYENPPLIWEAVLLGYKWTRWRYQ